MVLVEYNASCCGVPNWAQVGLSSYQIQSSQLYSSCLFEYEETLRIPIEKDHGDHCTRRSQ